MAIKLPMKFEDALSDLLKVKPPPKEKPKRKRKVTKTPK